MKPLPLRNTQFVPTLATLLERLHTLDAELTACAEELAHTSDDRERAAILAQEAALSKRKEWYVARIRAQKPVEALQVEVSDSIQLQDGM